MACGRRVDRDQKVERLDDAAGREIELVPHQFCDASLIHPSGSLTIYADRDRFVIADRVTQLDFTGVRLYHEPIDCPPLL